MGDEATHHLRQELNLFRARLTEIRKAEKGVHDMRHTRFVHDDAEHLKTQMAQFDERIKELRDAHVDFVNKLDPNLPTEEYERQISERADAMSRKVRCLQNRKAVLNDCCCPLVQQLTPSSTTIGNPHSAGETQQV